MSHCGRDPRQKALAVYSPWDLGEGGGEDLEGGGIGVEKYLVWSQSEQVSARSCPLTPNKEARAEVPGEDLCPGPQIKGPKKEGV